MIRVAVAGITGFVGSNLQKYFDEHSSILLEPVNVRHGDLSALDRNDVVLNLIGKAHDHKGKGTASDFFEVNYELVKLLFGKFLNTEAEYFIHISSIAAVEELKSESILTETSQSNSQSPYGKSKRRAEEYLLSQQLPDNKKLIIIRPTMIHGPGDKGNLTLLYNFVSKGIPYPLGGFDNQRSFIGIDNFCYLIEQVIEKRKIIRGGIYNFSDDTPLSTKKIIETIAVMENQHPKIISLPRKLVWIIAKIGDLIPLPLNSKSLIKMTCNLLVSNQKIKDALVISSLPFSAQQGLEKTIKSYHTR